MSMRSIRLNSRTTLCFGVVCLLLLIQGAMTLVKVDKVYSSTVQIETNWLPSIRQAGKMESTLLKLRLELRRFALDANRLSSTSVGAVKEASSALVKVSNEYASFVSSPEEKNKYDQVIRDIQAYNLKVDELLAMDSSHSAADLSVFFRDYTSPLAVKLQSMIGELLAINETGGQAAVATAAHEYDAARLFTLILMVASVLLTIVVARLFTKSIITPVGELLAATAKIAQGDLRVAIQISGKDELTDLQQSTAAMQMSLKSTLQHISEASGQLASAAEEMSSITKESSAGIERQSMETDQAATAVNEMTAAVEEVARNAVSASQSTQDSQRSAKVGQERVTQTIASIEKLSATVQQTGVEVEGLAKQAQDIARVVEVIRSIAEQTNLLALNAAIEAARAGEQGRGFAVVADEVRSLAQRTQASTAEISKMIALLQERTAEAGNAMQLSRQQMQESVGLAREAGGSIDSINGAVTQISDMNTLIATATEEQNAVTEELNRSIVNIHNAADENAQGAQQTAQACVELSKLANSLHQMTQRFTL